MIYNNPLSIFTEEQLQALELSPTKMKRFKKEILLQFQLTDETSVEFNGRSFDKNEVLEIFDDLQKNLTLHLNMYRDKELYDFLEKGDLAFFYRSEAKNNLINYSTYAEKINEFIVHKLDGVTVRVFDEIDKESVNVLKVIRKYTSKLRPEVSDKAYHKTYKKLSHHIRNLKFNYPTPLESDWDLVFFPEMSNLISETYFECLQSLPESFRDLTDSYAVWCQNFVLNPAFEKENRLSNFPTASLRLLLKAAQITSSLKTGHNKDLIASINNVLKTRTRRKFENKQHTYTTKNKHRTSRNYAPPQKSPASGLTTYQVLRFAALFFFFISMYARYSRSSSRHQSPPYSSYSDREKRESEKIEEILKQIELKRRDASGKSEKSEKQKEVKSGQSSPGSTEANTDAPVKKHPFRVRTPSEYEQIDLVYSTEKRLSKRRTPQSRKVIRYSGDISQYWNYKIIKTKKHSTYTDIYVETEFFPTRNFAFKSLIPQELLDKYEEMDFVFHFTNPDFPKTTFKHRLQYKRKPRATISYDEKESTERMELRNFATKKAQLRGTITRIDGVTRRATKRSFKISYDKKASVYKAKFGHSP
ncbi:MAG TPA: hypothetical protein ENI82_00385, partial [Bacteroidetes bacterium]|nr:hypothetical protein [Bacteroidota bacterium]